jgi:hypothetical protein
MQLNDAQRNVVDQNSATAAANGWPQYEVTGASSRPDGGARITFRYADPARYEGHEVTEVAKDGTVISHTDLG